MTTHTSGPWEASGELIVASKARVIVARVSYPHHGNEHVQDYREADDNRDVLAAAPDLLQALKDLTKEINLSKLNVRKDFSLLNAHACATKAIAKAEGNL
jgi:hypothetical protein